MASSNPTEALRTAVRESTVSVLRRHTGIRLFAGTFGAVCVILAAFLLPLWGVPVFSWLEGKTAIAPLLAAGLGSLYLWQLSTVQPGGDPARADRVLRGLVGITGAFLLVIGGIAYMLQDMPGISWIGGMFEPAVAGGLAAMGVWYVAGKHKVQRSQQGADLPSSLSELADLHSSGMITDDEFSRAKARLLE